MPIKFEKSTVKTVKGNDGSMQKSNVHYYMKCTSTKDLLAAYEKSGTIPKKKAKIKKELVSRGILNANV
jgi:hypothetical protein